MRVRDFAAVALIIAPLTSAWADTHTGGVPALSSRPGAAYTIYLNVAGFNYNGAWSNGELGLPGSTPSVGDVASNATFNAAQQAEIKTIFTRMAQSYIGFNVNVTTVDPAIAAGQAATDVARQAYYDATPNLMHTVVGSQIRGGTYVSGSNPEGKWYSTGADGVSGLGVVAGVGPYSGSHTNWMFTEDQQGVGFINGDYIGAISAHENAHALGLNHQGDWTGNTLVSEYSFGDAGANATTPGSYVPIIGNASDRQRIAWRVGDTDDNGSRVNINDVKSMLAISNSSNGRTSAADLHLVNDGIGHAAGTATPLPLSGNFVNPAAAKGVIVPISESNPVALSASNGDSYTKDWFSFTLTGLSDVTLTATDGTSFLQNGVADGNGTLRSVLKIFASNGTTLLGTGVEDLSTLFETYTGQLGAGTYYAQVASFGGHTQIAPDYNAATYFDMGAYFLTGSIVGVPEPTMVCIIAISGWTMLRRRRTMA